MVRFVAIGDSFTEGVGDELPDGHVRGWADLVAQGWANALGEPLEYANLAIRGKLVHPIIDEQLEAALALKPTHLSFNGGGNDMLRPGMSIERVVAAFQLVIERCDAEGVQLVLLSGANPSRQLPFGTMIQRHGDELSKAVVGMLDDRPDVIRALNWPDDELTHARFWSPDRLHMNARGHHRVAARVLEALGLEAPSDWWSLPEGEWDAPHLKGGRYYREHVLPWIRRRLTGTSSGDNRVAKFASWTRIEPV